MRHFTPIYSKVRLVGLFIFIALSMIAADSLQAAYRIGRPVGAADEPINQYYLYGEGTAVHKGLDWSWAGWGDNIYAVANGTVMQVVENRADNCHPPACAAWGNYVLIQHDEQHFDRASGQMGFVYSLYLHIRQNGVFVNQGDAVVAGQNIAQADNTGNSTGNHLHLQIVVHPQPNRTIEPYTLESEARSRNPELWLSHYPVNSGTAIGLVTDTNGNPVSDKYIYGMQKSAGGYGWNQTYVAGVNGDDIFNENFGTTDVTPGQYHIEARNANGTVYRDLGWHTFTGGQRTFVGLYPHYVPDIREGSGWDTYLSVRNNSTTHRARVLTTFFNTNGTVQQQRTDMINANGSLVINPPDNFTGAASVVASEDISVANLTEHTAPFASSAYVGVNNPGAFVWVPLVHRNNAGWHSEISIHNTGSATDVNLLFRPGTAGSFCSMQSNIPANGTLRLNTASAAFACLGGTFVGSLQINTASPVAVADLQYRPNYDSLIGSSAAVSPSQTLYSPLIQNNNSGWTSGFTTQNATSSSRTLYVNYFGSSSSACRSDTYGVAGYGLIVQYPAPPSAPPSGCTNLNVLSANFVSSGSDGKINAQVNQIIAGQRSASGYPAIANPTTKASVPHVVKNSTWSTGLQIQNTSSGTASVTVYYYYRNGSYAGSSGLNIPSNTASTLYPIPFSSFDGSAVVQSTNGKNIAVVTNQLKVVPGATGDTLMTHIAPNR